MVLPTIQQIGSSLLVSEFVRAQGQDSTSRLHSSGVSGQLVVRRALSTFFAYAGVSVLELKRPSAIERHAKRKPDPDILNVESSSTGSFLDY